MEPGPTARKTCLGWTRRDSRWEARLSSESFWSTVIVGLLFARMSQMVCRGDRGRLTQVLTKRSVSRPRPIVGVVESLPTGTRNCPQWQIL